MGPIRPLVLLAAACGALAVARPARPDGHEDGASTDDLLSVFRPFYGRGDKWGKDSQDVPWTDWWYANRRALIDTSPRARAVSDGAPAPEDPRARDRARTALLAALASKDPLLSSEAALALGRAGDVRDIATLAAIVRDRDVAATRRTHRYAAIGLGLLPTGDAAQAAEARSTLFGAIASARGRQGDQSFFWSYCAYSLAMRGDASVVPDLATLRRKALAAPDMRTSIYTEILGAMCYALGALGGDCALPEIAEHLGGRRAPDAGSNDTSWSATQALARVGGTGAVTLLLGAAKDERKTVRAGALQALGAIADPKDDAVAKVLRDAMADDRQMDCRRMAAVSLGRIGHTSAEKALLDALEDGTSEVRSFAAMGLGLLVRRQPNPKLAAVLVKALDRAKADEAAGSLALACAFAGAVDAGPRLAEIVESGGPTAAPVAAFALGMLGANETQRAVLRAAVAQPGLPLKRREAALALGALRDPAVVDQLRRICSGRTSDRDRATAVVCLGRVGTDEDIDFVLALLADRDTSDPMRACIVQALGWLLDRTNYGRLARIAADVKWDKQINGNSLSWSGEALWDVQHLVD